jgi:hypothetical protein
MRVVSATALALAGALSIAHLQAQQTAAPAAAKPAPMQMQDSNRKVPGGGIFAPGWQGKIDAGEASKGSALNDSKFELKGSDIMISTGAAAVYWNPANTAKGDYTVSATFTEPEYMSSNDHPHPYGIFIGGNKLGTDAASLLYCAPYGRGTFIVRGFGPAPFQMNGRGAPNDAVHKAAAKGASVTQDVAMSVKGDNVTCSINGTVVATYPKSDLVTAGKLDSTDGVAGIRVAHNVDVIVKDFKISK